MRWHFIHLGFIFAALAWPDMAAEKKADLRIDSPRDYQVFQRQTRLAGAMLIRGRGRAGDDLEYRLTGRPLEGKLPPDWRRLAVDPKDETFGASIRVPAGGWYRLEMRALRDGRIAGQTAVEHVGVGEVFVVAGQSNSTNYGSEKQRPRSGLVVSFDGKNWAIADDPQPGVHDRSTGGSFIPAFGDAMADRFKVPIAIASTGQGATSVRQWLMKGEKIEVHPTLDAFVKTVGPGRWECDGELYDFLMKRVQALGPRGFRAILWHQGESDAGQARAGYPADRQITGKRYTALTARLIRATRKQAGWDIPWFVAQATYHGEGDPADDEFRAAQKALADDGIAHLGPDTDALRKPYRAGVHFNGKGLQAHGRAWAEKVGSWLDGVLKTEGKGGGKER